jgi:hypothetical protein
MKTQLYYGIKLLPSSAAVTSIKGKNDILYRVTFHFETINLKADFVSVHRDGFGIHNAMCNN